MTITLATMSIPHALDREDDYEVSLEWDKAEGYVVRQSRVGRDRTGFTILARRHGPRLDAAKREFEELTTAALTAIV